MTKKCLYILCFALFLLLQKSVLAQKQYSGNPIFIPRTDTTYIPVIDLDIDESKLQVKTKQNSAYKVDQFAIPLNVDINTEEYGVWLDDESSEKKIWLLRIRAKNAQSLQLFFNEFHLVDGVKLFVYNRTRSKIQGAFTAKNNKEWGSFSLAPFADNELYIELQVPWFIEKFGRLSLDEVAVEISEKTMQKSSEDEYYDWSASCHVNVNCYTNTSYQTQKRSVCRIVYRGGHRCTGTLLNNLEYDQTPYVLTAAHCISTEFVAQTAVFVFGYESPSCEGEDTLISDANSISGAELISTKAGDLDFVLLKLSEKPEIESQPYYSGWDARDVAPTSSYTIHHPEGDVKKLSIDEDEAVSRSYASFDKNSFWMIANYEIGTSEAGSSGAGLISKNGYLVGSLTGGGDTCEYNIYDFYQKFSSSYDSYSAPENQLKNWLDPKQTNKQYCPSLDATEAFRGSAERISNVTIDDEVLSSKQSDGWGYLAGHNYQENSLFAEKFILAGSKYLYGANIDIAKQYASNIDQEVVFTIWEGASRPEKIVYEQALATVNLDITPYKINFDSTILVHNEFYFGYRINYKSDTFAVKTVSCTSDENTAFTFINNEWKPLQLNGNSEYSKLAVEVLAFDYLPNSGIIPDSNLISRVHLYPNPSENSFQLFFKEGVSGDVKVEIFNLQGRKMYSQQYANAEPNIHINHGLVSGMYVCHVFVDGKREDVKKIIVM